MYGLLLEGIYAYIINAHGEKAWEEIKSRAGIHQHSFSTHTSYTEMMIPRISKAAQLYLDIAEDEIMEALGGYFVKFVSKFGYDSMLKVQGRGLRDFLEGMDNLHEYLRLSYPKMKSPTFQCTDETKEGLTLHYRSKRKGFLYYVKGMIIEVANSFYQTNVEIEIKKCQMGKTGTYVILRLHFDNKYFGRSLIEDLEGMSDRPMDPKVFFHAFPFHIIFDRNMVIRHTGPSLNNIMTGLNGQRIDSYFQIRRPNIDFTFKQIYDHLNVAFELSSLQTVARDVDAGSDADGKNLWKDPKSWFGMGTQQSTAASEDDAAEFVGKLRLKGQMKYIATWESIVFMATPIIENLDRMFELGVYITDLSMHDVSRDLILVGTQQSNELTQALEQVQVKAKKMEEAFKRVEDAMTRTDSLLAQMIPKSVADRLQTIGPGEGICDTYDDVTILFSDIVGFADITGLITPMDVMSLLNSMFTKMDNLIEKHQVYKVETIADAYMVAAGAPEPNPEHAFRMCELALDMRESALDIIDPSTNDHIKLRIGLHSGPVVAGVVGQKMPRYCFFGDAVNTASRMESNSEGMKIHISQSIKDHVSKKNAYKIDDRGTITVKGKGEMFTYWLDSRLGEPAELPTPRVGAAEEGSFRRRMADVPVEDAAPAKAPSPPPASKPAPKPTPAPAPKPAAAPAPAPTPAPAPAPTPAPAPAPAKPAPAPAPAPVQNHAPAPKPAPAPAPAPAPVMNGTPNNVVNNVSNNVPQTTIPANFANNHNSQTPLAFLLDGQMNNIAPAQAIMKMHRSRLCNIL